MPQPPVQHQDKTAAPKTSMPTWRLVLLSEASASLQRPYTLLPLRMATALPSWMLVPPRSRSMASWLAVGVLSTWLFLPSFAVVSSLSTSLR